MHLLSELFSAQAGFVWAAGGHPVEQLARMLGAPITTSFGGRPAVDERLPNKIPMLPPLIDEVRAARNLKVTWQPEENGE